MGVSLGLNTKGKTIAVVCFLLLTGCTGDKKEKKSDWQDDLRTAKIAAFADNLDEAEKGFEKVLSEISKGERADTASIVEVKARLALVYTREGNFAKASPLIKDVIDFVKKGALDEEHSEILVLIDDTSESILHGPGSKRARLEDKQAALALQELSQDENRGRLPPTLLAIARAYAERGEIEKARPYYKRALSITEDRTTGSFTSNVIQLLRLCAVLDIKGYREDAQSIREQVKNFYPKSGPEKREAIFLEMLGKAYIDEGLYSKALVPLSKSLDLHKKLKHPDPLSNSRTMSMLARCKEALGEPEAAEPLLKTAIEIQETFPGKNNKNLYERMNEYASFLKRQKRDEEAEQWHDKSQAL
ncbi:MAG: tetratricopeptide repeat protein, partial [Cyanobacteria bacterium HKST-UBA02]|nr:tetratricopeptide repeat protein [Cyanobacteria bacterium HKST-UBA02]